MGGCAGRDLRSYGAGEALLTPRQVMEALQGVDGGERLRGIARSCDMSHSTILRLNA